MSNILAFGRADTPATKLDPRNVDQLCAAERWLQPPSSRFGAPVPGQVPEKMRALAELVPEDMPLHAELIDAADKAAAIYRAQILQDLDFAQIADDCAREPWTDKPLSQFVSSRFGYVPERFLEASKRFDDGPEKARYVAGYKAASAIYAEQMKKTAHHFADGKSRAEVEEMSAQLWRRFKPSYEAGSPRGSAPSDPGLEGTDIGARLLWIAHIIGHIHLGLVPNPENERADPAVTQAFSSVARSVAPVTLAPFRPAGDRQPVLSPFLQRRQAFRQAAGEGQPTGRVGNVRGFEDDVPDEPLSHSGSGSRQQRGRFQPKII